MHRSASTADHVLDTASRAALARVGHDRTERVLAGALRDAGRAGHDVLCEVLDAGPASARIVAVCTCCGTQRHLDVHRDGSVRVLALTGRSGDALAATCPGEPG